MVAPLAPAIATGLFRAALVAGETLEKGLIADALGEAISPEQTEIMIPVSSSAISAIGYKIGDIIVVEFKRGGSKTYEFPGTQELFMAFLAAGSKGEFFNAHFR